MYLFFSVLRFFLILSFSSLFKSCLCFNFLLRSFTFMLAVTSTVLVTSFYLSSPDLPHLSRNPSALSCCPGPASTRRGWGACGTGGSAGAPRRPRSPAIRAKVNTAAQQPAHLLLLGRGQVGGRGVRQHGAGQGGYVWIHYAAAACVWVSWLPLPWWWWWAGVHSTVHCTLYTLLCSSCTAVCCCTLQYSVHCSQTNK